MTSSGPNSQRDTLTNSLDGDDALYLVYGEIADRVRAALMQSREPDVSDLIAAHPDLADSIRGLVPTLATLQDIGSLLPDANASGAAMNSVDGTSQLGDFRILREVGRGGMGVVYEADQLSLNRRVALKILPFVSVLDDRQLRRFQNEALAAAQLDHPNLVDVYGVGCVRGVHYYAMRYVEGQTLAEIVRQLGSAEISGRSQAQRSKDARSARRDRRRFSSDALRRDDTAKLAGLSTHRSTRAPEYFGSVARVGAQIAEALEHAHQQGVVHRDVKPANIIVDAQGRPWLTDFGLARIEANASLTHSGDLVGTLRYMSPEQASGNPADHRCDIYGLGATLYELLTLQPPFDADERPVLVQQVASDDPVSPRSRNESIPLELETIVLKAMAKLPEERYATARELANDLDCFLQGKPIHARRPSLTERISKWSRRHKTAVIATMLLLIVLSAVSTMAVLRLNAALQLSESNRRRAVNAEQQVSLERDEALALLMVSKLHEAHALRLSRRAGQRVEAMRAIQMAASLARSRALTADEKLKLRNEAIASLALPDLQETWSTQRMGHGGIALEPQMRWFSQHDEDTHVFVRDCRNPQQVLFRFQVRQSNGVGMVSSRQGRWLLVRTHDKTEIWDMESRQKVWDLPTPSSWYSGDAFDFSPDDQTAAVWDGNRSVRMVDLSNKAGIEIGTISAHSAQVRVNFDPHGKRLAVSLGLEREIEIYDVASRRRIRRFGNLGDVVYGTAWSPLGQSLAYGTENSGALEIDVATGSRSRLTHGERSRVLGLWYFDNGQLLMTGSHNDVTLWRRHGGYRLLKVTRRGIAIPGGGDKYGFLSRASDKFGVWKVVGTEILRCLPSCNTVDFSSDGRLVVTAGRDGAHLWDVLTCGRQADLHLGRCHSAFFVPGRDMMLTYCEKYGLLRWSVRREKDRVTTLGPPYRLSPELPGESISPITLSQDGKRVGYVADLMHPRVLDIDDPVQSKISLPSKNEMTRIALSPDGRNAVTHRNGRGNIEIWDLSRRRVEKTLANVGGNWCAFARYSPGGDRLVAGAKKVLLFDTATWEPIQEYRSILGCTALSPDGQIMALSCLEHNGHVVKLVLLETGEELATLESPQSHWCRWITFNRAGTRLAVAGSTEVHLWDLALMQRRLSELDLDWQQPPSDAEAPAVGPAPAVTVDRGFLTHLDDARQHAKHKRWKDALASYEQALKLHPNDPQLISERDAAEQNAAEQHVD